MAYTPRAEPDNSDLEKEKELYASLYPPAGIAVNPNTGEALRPEQQGLLDQQAEAEEEPEEESSLPSPVAMGLLGAGASMLRQSGWRDTPITLGEQVGYAIPAGMQAYYNQTIMNQEEEDRLAGEQQAQVDAEDALENEQAFLLALNTTKLKIGQKEHLFGLYKHNPTKAYELLKELTDPPKKEGGKMQKVWNPETKQMEYAWFYPGQPPEFTGIQTGELSGEQKEAGVDERFKATHDLKVNTLGFNKEQAVLNQQNWVKSFEQQAGENLANRNERVRMNEHKILQDGIRNGFTVQQIENQVQQYREMAQRRGVEFDQTIDLKRATLNFRKESWRTEYDQKKEIDGRDHKQRIVEFEHKITQDGIRNGFTAQQIQNDIEQFTESMGFNREKFTKTHELKEKIFDWQVDDSIKKYNEQKSQFNKNLSATEYRYEKDYEYKVSESARKQGNANRNYNQGIVEHLALIQQRGKQNGYNEERIALAQKKFLQSQDQYKDDKAFREMQHAANVENRSAVLAQKVVEYEYKISRDEKGDLRKDTEWKQKLVEYQNKLVQQELDAEHWDKNYELKKDIFAADVEHKRLKLATEGQQAPQTLTGDAAREGAEENPNFTLPNKAGVPVIKLNKHGQFDSVDWIENIQYSDSQLSSMSRVQEKWMDSPEIRGGRKMVRLARSLRALADNKTGVSEFAMVYKFMKSLDETSTVLASEFRNAREAGLSAFDALELWGDKQFTGKQLDDQQKFEIVEAVRTVAYQRMNDINEMRESMIQTLVNRNVSREDAEKMVPNALQDYFDQYPYEGTTGLGERYKSGAPTSGLETMANTKYVGPESTTGRTGMK